MWLIFISFFRFISNFLFTSELAIIILTFFHDGTSVMFLDTVKILPVLPYIVIFVKNCIMDYLYLAIISYMKIAKYSGISVER